MKEGFLMGGCLILAGLLLQVIAGPVTWEVFAWPTNGIVMAGFLTISCRCAGGASTTCPQPKAPAYILTARKEGKPSNFK